MPDVEFALVFWVRKFVSLEEDALRDTGIFNSGLDDVNGVVVEVVVDDAFSDSVIFVGILYNWLLEISVEAKNLSVILEPLWCDLRNGILVLVTTASVSRKGWWNTLGHGHDEIWVDVLGQVHSFLCDGSIFNSKELGLMVFRDGWIGISVSWQEW